MNGIKTLSGSNTATCYSPGVHYFSSAPTGTPKGSSDPCKFGSYGSEDQKKMYDAYLCKLDQKSQFSKIMVRQAQTQTTEVSTTQPPEVAPPTTEEGRQRIKERYAEKEKERHIRMYEQALLMVESREKEDGRKFRSRRVIKFHLNYGTYFGQTVHVVGSAAALGGWNPANALPLSWEPGNIWTGSSILSTDDGVVEYKYILIDSNTGSIQWEWGYNHQVNTKEINSNGILIEDEWGSGVQ